MASVAKRARQILAEYRAGSTPRGARYGNVVRGDPERVHALLAEWGLDGLTRHEPVTLYHGTTRLFRKFDVRTARDELVDEYYGAGIFLSPRKRIAEEYAGANRNIGFPPSLIEDLKRKNKRAGAFLQALYTRGDAAWDDLTPDKLGVVPEEFAAAAERHTGNVDPNTLADIARYIIGSKLKLSRDDEPINIFSMSTGMPSHMYDLLDEVGLDSKSYRPKVYTVTVTVKNPLVTVSQAEARTARQRGYDSVVYFGPGIVREVPEVAVFEPAHVKVKHIDAVE